MSAFVVSKEHVDRLVRLAMDGPSDRGPVSPSNTWDGVRWFTVPNAQRAVREMCEQGSDYMAAYHKISRRIGHRHGLGDDGDVSPDQLGRMLTAQNIRSVEDRYPDTVANPQDRPGDIDQTWTIAYEFARVPQISIAEGLEALSCYEYQSCEDEGWADSEARNFCTALREHLCSVISRTANRGWDDWDRKPEAA